MILSLHHVTATVDDAQDDLDFCLGALGLRLVKRTVNFDNHHVYHFYYGDERGTPGTIWTTFPYKDYGVKVVPSGSLPRWKVRLRERGIPVADIEPRFGEETIRFSDRSGLVFELIATDRDSRLPWSGGDVAAADAVRGLHSVSIAVRDPAKTLELMTGLLGYAIVDETEGRIRVAVQGDAPGRAIDVVHDANAEAAVNGLGTVHHVAIAIPSEDEQLRHVALVERHLAVLELRDLVCVDVEAPAVDGFDRHFGDAFRAHFRF